MEALPEMGLAALTILCAGLCVIVILLAGGVVLVLRSGVIGRLFGEVDDAVAGLDDEFGASGLFGGEAPGTQTARRYRADVSRRVQEIRERYDADFEAGAAPRRRGILDDDEASAERRERRREEYEDYDEQLYFDETLDDLE